jgi:hypothetical protein
MKSFLIFSILFIATISGYPQKFKSLFNGKDLSGWKIHGTEKWYVEDGELVCESGPEKEYGYLSTVRPYKDFILKLAFKLEANGNSGVFIRSNIQGTTIQGWQVEVAPPNLFTGGIYESYGRGWLVKPKSEDEKYLRPHDWNQMVIQVQGKKVTTNLNGHEMVRIEDEKIGNGVGSIALQIHSGGGIKVRWKDILISELN